jgi:GntR family transcriptional regulator
MPIREELSHLKDEGLLTAHLGRVERVTDRPAHPQWQNQLQTGPARIVYRLLAVTEVRPPAEVADLLRLRATEKTVLRERDGYPFEMSRSHYPSSIAAGTPLAESRLKSGELDTGGAWL